MSIKKPKTRYYMECEESTAKKIRESARKQRRTSKAELDRIVDEFLQGVEK